MPRWTKEARAAQSERTNNIKPWMHTAYKEWDGKPQTHELRKGEFEEERLIRVYGERGLEVIFDFSPVDGFFYRVKKGRWYFHKNPVVNLLECEICQRAGTRRMVTHVNGVYGWNCEKIRGCPVGKSKTTLCRGCAQRVRAIVRKQKEAEKTRIILNKLKGAIRDERKNRQRENQDNRGIAGLPRQHDDRSEERRP